MKLKAYQVGNSDIVCAYSSREAVQIFINETGYDIEDFFEDVEECDLETKLVNESGEWDGETLGDLVALQSKPSYLFGWE